MPLVQDAAICIRKFEFSETSQVLTLLTREHGVVRLIAKGAHRRTKAGASKFDGGVDLLEQGLAVFSLAPDRDLPPLTEWALVSGQPKLRSSLRAMTLAMYAAELCALLIGEHDPHPAVFDRLVHLLAELATERGEEAFLAFELDLLAEVGLGPELQKCVSCPKPAAGSRGGAWFSSRRGGAVCADCEPKTPDRRPLDARLLRLAASIVTLPRKDGLPQRLPKLTRAQTDPINAMLADYLQHTLGRGLRMARHVVGASA